MTFLKIIIMGFVGWLSFSTPTEPIVSSTEILTLAEEEKVNQLDENGKRHGLWVIREEARMGEPAVTKMGYYEHGLKMGTWHTFDRFRVLIASEQFVYDELNGAVKYFDQHGLVCEGQFLGRNTQLEVDTIIATHPLTFMDTLVPVYQDMGSFKHGVWNFYNSRTKQLTRREFYQVGSLIKYEDVPLSETMDSTYIEKRIQQLPHNRKAPKKRDSRARNSLIR